MGPGAHRRPAARTFAARRILAAALERALVAALVLALTLGFLPSAACALTVSPLTAPSSVLVNAQTTYTCTALTTSPNETVPSAVFTFPPNTLLSGVSAATITAIERGTGDVYAVSGVVVNQAAYTVSFNMAFPKDKPAETVDIGVGGVVSASEPGAYTYSVTLTSSKFGPVTRAGNFSLSPNASAPTVGAVTVTPADTALVAGYSIPITVGATGRLGANAAAGANSIVIVFPAGTVVPSSPPAGSVTVNGVASTSVTVAGQRVTVEVPTGVTIPGGGTAAVIFDSVFGITNPPAGTYTIRASTSAQTGTGTSQPYSIAAAQFLTLTVGPGSLDFGSVSPGATTTPQTVTVHVSSSDPYTISRVPTGDIAPLGFGITGSATGTKAAGTADWIDSVTLTPPWSTDPDVTLQVNVQYTVVQ